MTTCAHPMRDDRGICTVCGDCIHDVILNGVCVYCGSTDIDRETVSPRPPRVIPPSDLVKKR